MRFLPDMQPSTWAFSPFGDRVSSNDFAKKVLNMFRVLGALVILIPLFVFVGSTMALSMFGWVSAFPDAFSLKPDWTPLQSSLQRGFAAALALGFLAALNVPVRFGSLRERLK